MNSRKETIFHIFEKKCILILFSFVINWPKSKCQ